MKSYRVLVATGAFLALAGWSGCRSSPPPEALFAEAEQLRLRYEKAASQEAVAKYREAMDAWQRRGEPGRAASAARQMGTTYGQLGLLRDSLTAYESALSLAQAAGERSLEGELRADVGMTATLVADREQAFADARTQCEAALALARQAHSARTEARALTCLGEVAYYSRRPDEALEYYVAADRLWEGAADQRGRAQALLLQGDVHSELSRFDQAHACFERAQALWRTLDDRRGRAITLVSEARLRVRRGEYQEALNRFTDALDLLQPMGDSIWEGSALTGVARVYQDMGDTRSALKYWERALVLFDAAGLKSVSVDVLNSLGESYLAAGDDAAALDRFERALALADEQGTPHWQAKALRFLGVVQLFRGSPGLARERLERSLVVQRSSGASRDPRLEARTRADLGEASGLLGRHEEAVEYFEQALALGRAARDRVGEARGLFGLARVSVERDRLDAALAQVEGSLRVVESLRTEVESRDLRTSYFASVYEYNEFHMDVLMRLHERRPGRDLSARAFAASERARARSLLDSLAEAGVDLRAGVDPELLARERLAEKAFDDWAQRQRRAAAAAPAGGDAARLAEEYRELEDRHSQIQAEIRHTSPRYAALVRPEPLGLGEVQRQVLDADTLLLEYALGDARSYLWAVSNTEHTSYTLAPRATIERAAQRVFERLTARLAVAANDPDRHRRISEADREYWQEAAALSEMLLRPVAAKLPGRRILLLVADGALQYLPFAALPIPGRTEPVPMLVEHEIVSLPSASVLAVLRRESAGRPRPARSVAVLADPVFEPDDPRLQGRVPVTDRHGPQARWSRLPATRQEADAIAAATPAGLVSRRTDFEASRAAAMSAELAQHRIVHFATHGVFDNENPGLSGVILSTFDAEGRAQDGFLRLHDIYGLQLPVELVVLSACSTALGRQVRGEGLVGIVRGFMYAGAKRVVASLWKVADEATGELMGRFYVEMMEKRRAPAAALREAQLAMWQQGRWRPPYYWAAFVLQGEWQ